MKHFALTAVSFLLIGLTMSGTAYSQIPSWEREALIAIYNTTDGDNWGTNTGWNGAAGTECDWYGVTCEEGLVTSLYLCDGGATGSIPPEIGNLTHLTYLNLSYNHLSGSIPPEFGNLTSLDRTWLNNNQLSGSIPPELGNLKKLRILELSQNQLTGSIPPEIGNMTSLWNLRLDIGYFLFTNHYRRSDSTSIKKIQWT